jgi:flagellar protein FliS
MYGQNNAKAYQNSEIQTADRGKLLLMVYDHCIKWCQKAIEAIEANNIEARTKAIFKIQDGITELICSLDFDKGGEVATNLHQLYDFYNRHLSEANVQNSSKHVKEVHGMLSSLRSAWDECIQNVRTRPSMNMNLNNTSYVSLLG